MHIYYHFWHQPPPLFSEAHSRRLTGDPELAFGSKELASAHNMTKTRRQRQAAAAAANEQDGSSPSPEESHSRTIDIPEDVDLDSLSDLLPDINLTNPSPDAIVSLYRLLLSQASDIDTIQRDLDEERADSEKKDVEFDQALSDRETFCKELEASLEAVQKELKQVKEERDQLRTLHAM